MSLAIEVDLRSHVPIYIQIVERVGHLVATAVLQPGDQLPTVRGLAAQLGVNFNTVARAYRRLAASGVVSTQPGRGTYILEAVGLDSAHSVRSRKARLKALARQYVAQARRLGFSAHEIRDATNPGS